MALTASAEDRSLRILCKTFPHSFPHAILARAFLPTMSEESLDLLQQAVRNILAALQMPDVDDNEQLHDLALHIGHIGKTCPFCTSNHRLKVL